MSYYIQEVLKKYSGVKVEANKVLAEDIRRSFSVRPRDVQESMLFMARGKDEAAGQFFLIPSGEYLMEQVMGQAAEDSISAVYPKGQGKPFENIRQFADARMEIIRAIEKAKKAKPNVLQMRDPARAGRPTYLYELSFAQLIDLCAAMGMGFGMERETSVIELPTITVGA